MKAIAIRLRSRPTRQVKSARPTPRPTAASNGGAPRSSPSRPRSVLSHTTHSKRAQHRNKWHYSANIRDDGFVSAPHSFDLGDSATRNKRKKAKSAYGHIGPGPAPMPYAMAHARAVSSPRELSELRRALNTRLKPHALFRARLKSRSKNHLDSSNKTQNTKHKT